MDIPVNVNVECVDGACGRSTRVVIDPAGQKVTHLVVQDQGFPRTERVVAIDMIRESTPQLIRLRYTHDELARQPQFADLDYRSGSEAWQTYAPGQYLFSPGALPAQAAVPLERQNIPAGNQVLQRGAKVEASDGEVGQVADVIVDPVSDEITHLIVEQGGLFRQRRFMLVADQVDRIAEGTVYLNMDRRAVEALPDREVR